MDRYSDSQKALAAYIAVCILWGSTYLAIRIGVAVMPPMLFAGIRFLIAGSILMAFVRFKKLSFPQTRKEIINQSIVGAFLLLGGNGLVVWAEQWISSGSASLIVAVCPLFMALIELFIPGRQRIDWKGWIGLLIGFSGVAYLVLGKSGATGIDLAGGAVMLAASLFWAFGSVYSKGFKTTGSIYAGIGVQMLAGGILLTFVGLVLGEASRFTLNPEGLMSMAYLIVFGSLIGYSSYIYLLQKWPAAKAGTYSYVNPIVAVLLGSLILGEPLTLEIFISAGIILLGVYVVQTSKIRSN